MKIVRLPWALRACWILSIVWGITPSSAATTRTTTSVTRAPRARISANAKCPGVSMNVIGIDFEIGTKNLSIWIIHFFVLFNQNLPTKAPMCCVIPPNSVETMSLFLKASSKLVFPWSTCPIIVTTGGRVFNFSSGGIGLETRREMIFFLWWTFSEQI